MLESVCGEAMAKGALVLVHEFGNPPDSSEDVIGDKQGTAGNYSPNLAISEIIIMRSIN